MPLFLTPVVRDVFTVVMTYLVVATAIWIFNFRGEIWLLRLIQILYDCCDCCYGSLLLLFAVAMNVLTIIMAY